MGNTRVAALLFHWTEVKKALVEVANGQINQNTADLLFFFGGGGEGGGGATRS